MSCGTPEYLREENLNTFKHIKDELFEPIFLDKSLGKIILCLFWFLSYVCKSAVSDNSHKGHFFEKSVTTFTGSYLKPFFSVLYWSTALRDFHKKDKGQKVGLRFCLNKGMLVYCVPL